MGNLCWGAPLHRFMTRSSNEFPDVRVQYQKAFYKKLFKYPYSVKRDIFRCLCEGKLNADR